MKKIIALGFGSIITLIFAVSFVQPVKVEAQVTNGVSIDNVVVYLGNQSVTNIQPGNTYNISWSESGTKDPVNVSLYNLVGSEWKKVLSIATANPVSSGQNSVSWSVPANFIFSNSQNKIYVETIGAGGQIYINYPTIGTSSITVLSPNGDLFSSPTSTIPFSWNWTGVNYSAIYPVVYLLDQNGNTIYSASGIPGGLIYSSQGGSGVFPAPVNLVIPTGVAHYRVKVCVSTSANSLDHLICGTGNYFTISKTASSTIGLYPNISVAMVSPKGGEVLQIGTKYTIRWSNSGLPANATQYISIMNGTKGNISDPNSQIVTGLPANVTSYTWTVAPNTGWGIGMKSLEQKVANFLGINTVLADSNQYIIGVGVDLPGVTGDVAWSESAPFTIASSSIGGTGGGGSGHTICYPFYSNLTLGSRGADVVALQTFLINSGYDIHLISIGLTSKGYFGASTQSALANYQRDNGIAPANGYFGPVTRAMINASCTSSVQSQISAKLDPASPVSNIVQISPSTQTVNVPLFVFDVKSQNINSSLQSLKLNIQALGDNWKGNQPNTLFSNIQIRIGGLLYSAINVSNDTGVVLFNNINIPLIANVNTPITVYGTVAVNSNNFLDNSTAVVTLPISSLVAIDSNYNTVSVDNSGGVVTGSLIRFVSGSTMISNISTTKGTLITDSTGRNQSQTFTLNFTLTAGNDPIYLSKSVTDTGSMVPNSSIVFSAKAPFIVPAKGGYNTMPYTSDTSSYFMISPGASRQFVYTGSVSSSYDNVSSVNNVVKVAGINYGTNPSNLSAYMITSGLEGLMVVTDVTSTGGIDNSVKISNTSVVTNGGGCASNGTCVQQSTFNFALTAGNNPVYITSDPRNAVNLYANTTSINIVSSSFTDNNTNGDGSDYFYIAPGQTKQFTYTVLISNKLSTAVSGTVALNKINYGSSNNSLFSNTITTGLEKLLMTFQLPGNIGTVGTSTQNILGDLVPIDFTWTPVNPQVSQNDPYSNINFTLTIKNVGSGPVYVPSGTDFNVTYNGIIEAGLEIGTGSFTLQSGEVKTLSNVYSSSNATILKQAGTYALVFDVDGGKTLRISDGSDHYITESSLIKETRKDNNSMTKLITVVSAPSKVQPPVITGGTAPASLKVGETGTWTVNATDQKGLTGSGAAWGDGMEQGGGYSGSGPLSNTFTFTHAYSKAGTYTVTFTVSNSSGLSAKVSSTLQVYDVVATPVPSITILSPNGGETFTAGQNMNIKWNSSNFQSGSTVYIELRPQDFSIGKVTKISVVSSSDTNINWQIPNNIASGKYIIEVYRANEREVIVSTESVKDISDSYFTITAPINVTPKPLPSIQVSPQDVTSSIWDAVKEYFETHSY